MRERRVWAAVIAAMLTVAASLLAITLPPIASAQNPETLTVTLAGTGAGSVTDSNHDFHCPSTCSYTYDPGAVVELTASADGGDQFAGWSGAGCSGTGSCIVTMNQAEGVTATFE